MSKTNAMSKFNAVIVSSFSMSVSNPVSVTNPRSVVDEVDVTEVSVVIVSTTAVLAVGGVSGTWGAGLFVGVTVGANYERGVVSVVKPVVAAFASITSVKGKSSVSKLRRISYLTTHHSRYTNGEHNQPIHSRDFFAN